MNVDLARAVLALIVALGLPLYVAIAVLAEAMRRPGFDSWRRRPGRKS